MKNLNDLKSIIVASPLFQGLPAPHIDQIAAIAVEKSIKKGMPIFFEGDEGNGFFLVASGKVKVYKNSAEGKEKILHIIEKGEPFGEVAVFTGRSFPANAQTISNCTLLFFPRREFIQLISENPSLSLNMMAILTQRLKQFAVQIEHLSLKDVPGRLADYLLILSREQQNQDQVKLTITKGQLASLLGTIAETLSRILARMSQNELIEVSGKDIRILDLEGLKALAESGRFEDQGL